MKPLYLFAILVLFAACKKEKTEPYTPVTYNKPDFALVPTKDAKWYIHVISDYNCFPNQDPADINIEGVKDNLWNLYYVLSATGIDSSVDGYTYHIYIGTVSVVDPPFGDTTSPSERTRTMPYSLWLREDTAAQKIYNWHDKDSLINEYYLVADFSDNANKGLMTPFPTWPVMKIMRPEGYVLRGEVFKSWDMLNTVDGKLQYFYKAIGIGNPTGLLPYRNADANSKTAYQPVSLDFVYKGDSIHFDFPLQ
jgi:hypothetical protein